MYQVAILGLGNVGRKIVSGLEKVHDLKLAGIIRRPESLLKKQEEFGCSVVTDIDELPGIDGVFLALPSRNASETAESYLERGYATVDCYDEHGHIFALKEKLDPVAKNGKTVAIVSSGWDPGTDSMVRAVMKILSPVGTTFTTFGGDKGGKSMGHSAAVRAIEGVKHGISLTFPNGKGKHKRMVYVTLQPGADFKTVEDKIKKDPYFAYDPTTVTLVETVDPHDTLNHGCYLEREDETGETAITQIYRMNCNNPEATANSMIASMRAALRAREKKNYGALTMLECPLSDFLEGSLEERLKGY